MKKRLLSLLLAGAMALSLAACSNPGSASSGSAASQSASSVSSQADSSTQSEAAFPVTVTDAAGREVTIAEQPEKLVSGYYITTSMLIALGHEDKLVGIEAKADTRPIYALAAPELLELPSVGTAKEFDLEGCAALEPDLVILPLKLKDTVPALEELGLTVITVNPESLEELNETIRLFNAAIGDPVKGWELLDYNQQTEEFLAEILADVEKPSVYLAGNSSYLSTAGAAMYQNTLLEMGGGENVAAELEDTYWADVSYEQLLAWNPEVIIMASDAAYSKEELLADPQLQQLDAVKNGRVYAMPSAFESWDSPVPSALVGSRWVVSVLHGEEYAFEQFQADAADFYQQFYGVEIDTQLLSW